MVPFPVPVAVLATHACPAPDAGTTRERTVTPAHRRENWTHATDIETPRADRFRSSCLALDSIPFRSSSSGEFTPARLESSSRRYLADPPDTPSPTREASVCA